MAVTINGTTGLATDSTSAVVEAVSLNHPSSATAAITMDASDNVTVNGAFTSQGIDDNATSTAITLDSSGNVGIGTSSPATSYGKVLHIHNDTTTGSNLRLTNSTSGSGTGNGFEIVQIGADDYIINRENGAIIFYTNNTERLRLLTAGALYIGEANPITSGDGLRIGLNTGSSGNFIRFKWAGAEYGSVTLSGGGISYNTSSDYRLKENVVDLTGASDRVNQIPVHRFNFISNPDTTVDGFLAHEVQAVVPEAITGTHNEVDEDGNPVYQQIDQAKIVPLLTAALQEALAKIETLETEMTSVKARLEALETP